MYLPQSEDAAAVLLQVVQTTWNLKVRTAFKNPLKHSIHRNTAALIQVLFYVMYYMSQDSSMSLQAAERNPLLEHSGSL